MGLNSAIQQVSIATTLKKRFASRSLISQRKFTLREIMCEKPLMRSVEPVYPAEGEGLSSWGDLTHADALHHHRCFWVIHCTAAVQAHGRGVSTPGRRV